MHYMLWLSFSEKRKIIFYLLMYGIASIFISNKKENGFFRK